MKYPHLFEPIRLAGTYFRNRIFASPTGWQEMTDNGQPYPESSFYYGRKAMGGVASVAVGELVVDGAFGRSFHYHVDMDNVLAGHG
ncbi:MAG: 2-enoate reductase, partial [Clostridiales Family XIII bacterium]|nr:2-enoate reductase [Clostridiales Family XIII bacterium]